MLRRLRPLLQQQRSYNNIGSTVAPDATRVKELQRYGRNLEVQALVSALDPSGNYAALASYAFYVLQYIAEQKAAGYL